jgi:catechol 2,3-dioxygenase-like lactoylglutathione lyase family enzyme
MSFPPERFSRLDTLTVRTDNVPPATGCQDGPVSHDPQSYLAGHLVVVIDCADLDRSARFWTRVLGYVPDGPPGERYQSLVPAGGQGIEILLQRVPEAKSGKNRLHLDLRTADLDAEAGRVVALGARRLTSTPVTESGWRWHIFADPDGNEFCVLQPPAAYWQEQPGA